MHWIVIKKKDWVSNAIIFWAALHNLYARTYALSANVCDRTPTRRTVRIPQLGEISYEYCLPDIFLADTPVFSRGMYVTFKLQ